MSQKASVCRYVPAGELCQQVKVCTAYPSKGGYVQQGYVQ